MSTFIFVGGGGSLLKKYNESDLSFVDSVNYGNTIYSVATSGNYVYVGGKGGVIKKYLKSDLSFIASSISYGNSISAMAIKDDYIYVVGIGFTPQGVYRYKISDLSYVDKGADLGGLETIIIKGNYIYTSSSYLYQLNISDLATINTSSWDWNDFISANNSYIYGVRGSTGEVHKYNLSNLSEISTHNYSFSLSSFSSKLNDECLYFGRPLNVGCVSYSPTGGTIIATQNPFSANDVTNVIINTSQYVFSGGFVSLPSEGYFYKLNPDTLTVIDSNLYGNRIYAMITDEVIDTPQAPTNLTATTVSYESIEIQWENNSSIGVNVVQTYVGGNWITIDTLALSASGYTLSNLDWYTEYTIRVAVLYDGTYYPSNTIIEKTLSLPPPLCTDDWNDRFTVVDSTCGNVDGQVIFINPEYLRFYDVILRDNFGNYKYFDTDPNSATFGQSQYLFAGWYAVQATPKAAYSDYYGNDECRFTWIPVAASNTTMTLDSVSIRDVVCGGFGAIKGRIVYFMSDTVQNTYQFYLYKDIPNEIDGELLDFQDNLTYSQFQQVVEAPLDPATYYAIGYNKSNGCILLMGGHTIAAKPLRAVAGIRRVFITEWNNQIEYNYWSESDEDYYVSGVDSDFFNSIKIKEFIDSTLPSAWFEIKLDTKGILYNQTMNKTHQGFIFTDSMEITIPHADNVKWKQLVDFLVDRYIIVFQDNNSQWWTIGYRLGAKVDSYKRANNEYILTLNAISDNKILTNIDETYVNDNIINS